MPICALALQAGVQGQQMTPLSGLIANGTTLRHLVCEVVMPIWALALQAGGQHKYPDGQHKYPNGQPNARHQVHEGPARVRSPSLQGWGASCTCECVRVHLCICVCMRAYHLQTVRFILTSQRSSPALTYGAILQCSSRCELGTPGTCAIFTSK